MVKIVHSFLGLVNFYHCFVPNFADTADPLTALTGKHVQFRWETMHQQAFDKLKHALVPHPYLIIPGEMTPSPMHQTLA